MLAESGPDMRLTERFTRIDADTLRYQATVDDPLPRRGPDLQTSAAPLPLRALRPPRRPTARYDAGRADVADSRTTW